MDYGKLFARRGKIFQVIHKLQKNSPWHFAGAGLFFGGRKLLNLHPLCLVADAHQVGASTIHRQVEVC